MTFCSVITNKNRQIGDHYMNFKDLLSYMFTYTPDNKQTYHFNLVEDIQTKAYPESDIGKDENPKTKIFPSLTVNIDYLKSKFNLLINSDIIFRNFVLNARGKQYQALLIFIDGMINTEIMNEFILEPLMMRNKNNLFEGSQNKVISEAVANNITVRKVKKFNLPNYISSCLVPQNAIKQVSTFEEIISGINSGNCALFIDTLDLAFDIEVKGFKQRGIEKPSNEIVIKGPHESFVENIRTNTSLIRRFVNNENLIIENVNVGNITKTKCGVCYISGLANEDLIAEVKFRMHNLDVDALLSAGQLEQLITDSSNINSPQLISTERPDKTASYLLDGRVIILVNGSPYAIITPGILSDFLSSPDDKNQKALFSNFTKFIRLLAAFITLLLPGLYIAVTSFHQEILPTELLFSILASRANVPFPIIFELLVLEISFELIREAGLRVPSPIGPTIGIVGALVMGQAAVSAGIVSPILIIVVAITGTASFAIPDYAFGFHLRVYRFLFIFLGYLCGFLGIALGLFTYMVMMCDSKSFGVPYTTGISPLEHVKGSSYFLPPVWKREYRSGFLNSKKTNKQGHISMKWKNS